MKKEYDVIIIGAGLSGLSTAHFLNKLSPGLKVLLLEKTARPGGAVQSFKKDGFLAEWGPHGFLDNAPASREILEDTGLDREAQQAPLGDFHRYVCHRGKLVQLPQKPPKILTTPLLSPAAKLRLLGDFWIKPIAEDQTIGEWAGHRFGKSILPLVDAAITGSFSGDYTKLSIDAVMPGVRRLEKEQGSVLKALIRKAKDTKGGPKKQLPAMKNFPQGLERLVDALVQGRDISLETSVAGITKNEQWEVTTAKGTFFGKELVMALPVNEGLELLSPLDTPPVSSVPVSRIINVVLGFSKEARVPYGFGYLAPECEKRFTLGAMFSSHMFPNRAPGDAVLLEALVGGRRHPERLELSDEEIIEKVLQDIRQLIDLPEKPVFARVLRPKSGIPQLEMDHPALLDWRFGVEQKMPGLYICGFGWDGIGINDMTKSAKRVAEDIVSGRRGETPEAPVKPVYF
ncbi:MAG: protoporphyrinogen oxidase [Desulfobulbaceae bacterium]|uniref:Coproporphyrinogen III oxidase n=1 Tax=Candidatus Desulfobia pelagia TaxID=2841692 RepID=A0A8J6ND76_9BACT|nr:protoporphyrinogen oxidase [Candidatus Desulfobia pelagia]